MIRLHTPTRSHTTLCLAATTLCLLWSNLASADGNFALLHNSTDTNETNGVAIAVAVPSEDNGRIQVKRLRLSSSSTTALDFQLRAARKTDALGDTQNMSGWTCTLPGCQEVFAIEGVKAGQLYDLDGLELNLLPGERLYLFSDADIGVQFFSLEVWWEDR